MTEQALLNYFQDKISEDELAIDLTDSQKKTSHDTTSVYIAQMASENEFVITEGHRYEACYEQQAVSRCTKFYADTLYLYIIDFVD